MRLGRPSWMAPVDSVGEWIGFLGGLMTLSLVVLVIAGAISRPFSPTARTVVHGIGLVPHFIAQAACGFDPTDPCNWSLVVVRNDIRSTVSLEPCDHHGGRGDHCGPPLVVGPGQLSPTGQYDGIAAETGQQTWVAVASHGRRLGCLVLDGHSSKRDGDLVLVSEAERCGNVDSPSTKPVGRTRL